MARELQKYTMETRFSILCGFTKNALECLSVFTFLMGFVLLLFDTFRRLNPPFSVYNSVAAGYQRKYKAKRQVARCTTHFLSIIPLTPSTHTHPTAILMLKETEKKRCSRTMYLVHTLSKTTREVYNILQFQGYCLIFSFD